MKTDRELLELAAKAAGMDDLECGTFGFYRVIGMHDDGKQCMVEWNPLTDDGDTMRLAVKLNLHISIDAESAGGITVEWDFDEGGLSRQSIEQDAPAGGDDYAATRRAVVRAAAAIGEGL